VENGNGPFYNITIPDVSRLANHLQAKNILLLAGSQKMDD
jgi:hypothetical protein